MCKKSLTLTYVTFVLSLLNSCLFSYPLLLRIWQDSGSIRLLLAGFVFNFVATHLIYSLIFFPKTIVFLSYIFFIINGCGMYFINTYGVYLNKEMMLNVLSTDIKECRELLNINLVYYILASITILSIFWCKIVVVPTTYGKLIISKVCICSISILLFFILTAFNYKSIASFVRLNKDLQYLSLPSSYFLSTIRLCSIVLPHTIAMQEPLIPLDVGLERRDDNLQTKRKKLVIFIVGEAARAKSFSLNGYARNTNDPLHDSEIRQQIINLPFFYSCATATALSVPCIFSHLQRTEFNIKKAARYENLLDLLYKNGVNVQWLDNNSGCQGVCARVPNISYYDIDKGEDEVRDEAMLRDISELIDFDKDNLIILHQKGSHGPAYYKRVPEHFKMFKPECKSVYFDKCAKEEIVNSYDNTIYYTSYFIKKSIEFLLQYTKNFDVALLYVSDHGESLGENGLYLHGAPYFLAPEEQTHIPAIFWFAPNSSQKMLDYQTQIMQKTQRFLSHDYIYHSILSLFQFTAVSSYNPNLDLFHK